MTCLLENAFSGSILILVIFLIRRLFYKLLPVETWLILWLVCMVRLLNPAMPASPVSFYNILNISSRSYFYEYSESNEYSVNITNGHLPNKAFHSEEDYMQNHPITNNTFDTASHIIYSLYILGVSIFVCIFFVNWIRTYRSVRNAKLFNNRKKLCVCIPDFIKIKEGKFTDVPFTFGVIVPIIVLPSRIPNKFLKFILLHESIHAKRRDNLWHYLMALITVIYWWNPIIWFMAFYLRRDIEISCDYAVLRICENDCRKEYAEALILM